MAVVSVKGSCRITSHSSNALQGWVLKYTILGVSTVKAVYYTMQYCGFQICKAGYYTMQYWGESK